MSAAGQKLLATILPDMRRRLAGVVPEALVDAFLAEAQGDLIAILDAEIEARARAKGQAPAQAPEEPGRVPDALHRCVLDVTRGYLGLVAQADEHELWERAQKAALPVTYDRFLRWLHADPYVGYDFARGKYRLRPPTPGGERPPWITYMRYQDIGGGWTCVDCGARVPDSQDPLTIQHYDLCIRGPVQFPAHKLPRIEELFGALNQRAARLGVGGGLTLEVTRRFIHLTHQGAHGRDDPWESCGPGTRPEHWVDLPYVEVRLSGEVPKIPGWTVIGTIEHGPEGNILRDAPGQTLPAHYRRAGADCEHCCLDRNRKETVVLRSDKGETKQVGLSCLEDYLGSTDAAARVRAFLEWQATFAAIREALESAEDFEAGEGISHAESIGLQNFLAWVSLCVREGGFVTAREAESSGRPSTGMCAWIWAGTRSEYGPPRRTDEDFENARKALAWAQEHLPREAGSNFDHNLAVLVERGHVDPRSVNLAQWIYERWRISRLPPGAQGRPLDEWRPEEIGQVVQMRLAVKRKREDAVESSHGSSDLYVFADEDGRELVLFTSAAGGPEVGDVVELSAEIVERQLRNGLHQTKIKKRSRGWTVLRAANEEGKAA